MLLHFFFSFPSSFATCFRLAEFRYLLLFLQHSDAKCIAIQPSAQADRAMPRDAPCVSIFCTIWILYAESSNFHDGIDFLSSNSPLMTLSQTQLVHRPRSLVLLFTIFIGRSGFSCIQRFAYINNSYGFLLWLSSIVLIFFGRTWKLNLWPWITTCVCVALTFSNFCAVYPEMGRENATYYIEENLGAHECHHQQDCYRVVLWRSCQLLQCRLCVGQRTTVSISTSIFFNSLKLWTKWYSLKASGMLWN